MAPNLALVFILQGRLAEAEVAQALKEAPESRQLRDLAARLDSLLAAATL